DRCIPRVAGLLDQSHSDAATVSGTAISEESRFGCATRIQASRSVPAPCPLAGSERKDGAISVDACRHIACSLCGSARYLEQETALHGQSHIVQPSAAASPIKFDNRRLHVGKPPEGA